MSAPQQGKERLRCSLQKSEPPSQGAAHNPEQKRKRQRSGKTQPHRQGQHPQGLDTAQGPGAALSMVRSAMGNTAKTPEGKGQPPPLGRKPAGPRPGLEAAGQEEFEPPTMSFEAYLTYDQPPARKRRRSGKTPATALPGKRLAKEDSTGAKAEAGQSHRLPPPAPARAPLSVLSPTPAPWPALPGLGPCQLSDPPLSEFPGTSSFQPTPRALPAPRREEGAGPRGVRLNSRSQGLSGSKRARLSRTLSLLKQCVQALQDSVYLLSQVRGVPCPAFELDLGSDGPEQLPDLEEPHGAPAAQTDPSWKEHCQPALEKDTREQHKSLREPQEQEVAEQVLQISANRPNAPLPEMAFSASCGTGGAAAVQGRVLPAPSPTTGTPGAPSGPARSHSGLPIPGKQALSSHKKPMKKPAPLMAKSIRDYKNRYSRR